jgi:hypothetical protein
MAKAIIPLGSKNVRQMDRMVQQMFLKALHAGK